MPRSPTHAFTTAGSGSPLTPRPQPRSHAASRSTRTPCPAGAANRPPCPALPRCVLLRCRGPAAAAVFSTELAVLCYTEGARLRAAVPGGRDRERRRVVVRAQAPGPAASRGRGPAITRQTARSRGGGARPAARVRAGRHRAAWPRRSCPAGPGRARGSRGTPGWPPCSSARPQPRAREPRWAPGEARHAVDCHLPLLAGIVCGASFVAAPRRAGEGRSEQQDGRRDSHVHGLRAAAAAATVARVPAGGRAMCGRGRAWLQRRRTPSRARRRSSSPGAPAPADT